MNDMTMTGPEPTALFLPLDDLYLHPLNTRSEPPPLEIAALAESIGVCGLMQNLLGFEDPEVPGKIGIVAGGRRLRALQMLATSGTVIDPIPVKVTRAPVEAQSWAMAENTARAPLHPADEIVAYGRMRDAGAPPATIARAFAVTERHVRGRLRLADLPGPVLVALKSGGINLSEAEAFTLSDDEAQILDVLNRIGQSQFNDAAWVRRQLTGTRIAATDRRARFVTVDLYEASGGRTTRDLFSDAVFLHDETLLNTLFDRRLSEEVARIEAEGWGFVWHTEKGENWHNDPRMFKCTTIEPPKVDLPDGDLARLEELSETDELTDEELEELDALEARQVGDFPDDQKETLGAFVWVDFKGTLCVSRGLQIDTAKHAEDAVAEGGTPAAEKPSQAVREDLLTIRRAAAQGALMANPALAVDLLAYHLHFVATAGHSFMLGASFTTQNVTPGNGDGLRLPERLAADRPSPDYSKRISPEGFATFLEEHDEAARMEIIANAIARSFAGASLSTLVEERCRTSPRLIWTPTAKGYFSRLPESQLDAIFAELVESEIEDDIFAAFSAQKKKDKARDLDDLFNGHDLREAWKLSRDAGQRIDLWVPPEMRGD